MQKSERLRHGHTISQLPREIKSYNKEVRLITTSRKMQNRQIHYYREVFY